LPSRQAPPPASSMGCAQSSSGQARRKSRQLDRERYGYAVDSDEEDLPKKPKSQQPLQLQKPEKQQKQSLANQQPEPEADQQLHPGRTRRVQIDSAIRVKYNVSSILHRTEHSNSLVLKAVHRDTHEPFALKLVPAARASRFRTELSAIRRARHPNIVRCVTHIETPRFLCLVLELATGDRLSQRLNERGRLPELQAAVYSAQLLDGLAHLHSFGCAHRNIRTENLLFYHVGPDSRLLIIDFACALLPDSPDSEALAPPGSSASETPEGVDGRPCGQPADIWAVGMVTVAMLTGRKSAPVRPGQPPLLPQSLSEPARQFLAACLRPDPADRPAAAEARRCAWLTAASAVTAPTAASQRSASSSSEARRAASQSGSSSRCSSSRLGDSQLSETGTELRSNSDSTCS
ncbi:hypothetical protein BOX15_Mlig017022g1, partial [Macrostomum lignano]